MIAVLRGQRPGDQPGRGEAAGHHAGGGLGEQGSAVAVQADETPVRCNDPDEKRGGTTQGWLWVISRPGGDVVFDWRLSRRHGELTSLLNDYRRLLQSDAYGAVRREVAQVDVHYA
ncbi:MAG: transposase [Opitutae bacterium]|nr:transposase [Opitutae bacterium]